MKHIWGRYVKGVKGRIGDITGGPEGLHTYTISFLSLVRKRECSEATNDAISGWKN